MGTPSVSHINERILDHNAELTGFVSRLSDEKMELRKTLSKLEEDIWQYRQREELQVCPDLLFQSQFDKNKK